MAEWARDVVVPILARHPSGVGKDDLQAEAGLGTEDLREALNELEERGEIEGTEEGWRLVEGEPERTAVVPEEARAGEEPAVPPPEEEEPTREMAAVALEEPQYRARIAVDATFANDPDVEGSQDEAAVADAHRIRSAAVDGILAKYPDLTVSSALEAVEVFETPRRIYPADG